MSTDDTSFFISSFFQVEEKEQFDGRANITLMADIRKRRNTFAVGKNVILGWTRIFAETFSTFVRQSCYIELKKNKSTSPCPFDGKKGQSHMTKTSYTKTIAVCKIFRWPEADQEGKITRNAWIKNAINCFKNTIIVRNFLVKHIHCSFKCWERFCTGYILLQGF